jgi:hypothetical protein
LTVRRPGSRPGTTPTLGPATADPSLATFPTSNRIQDATEIFPLLFVLKVVYRDEKLRVLHTVIEIFTDMK